MNEHRIRHFAWCCPRRSRCRRRMLGLGCCGYVCHTAGLTGTSADALLQRKRDCRVILCGITNCYTHRYHHQISDPRLPQIALNEELDRLIPVPWHLAARPGRVASKAADLRSPGQRTDSWCCTAVGVSSMSKAGRNACIMGGQSISSRRHFNRYKNELAL